MNEHDNPMRGVLRTSYGDGTVTRVECPKCAESIPAKWTAHGVPGGEWYCLGCTHEFVLPRKPPRVQRESRPRLSTSGVDCNLPALLERARRAAFAAGWTADEWAATAEEITAAGPDEFDARIAARFELVP